MATKNKKNYEELGHMLEDIYESASPTRRQIYKVNFIKGVVSGFGGVLGATILIGLLLWMLSLFNRLPPPIGPFIDALKRTVQQH